MSYMNHPSKRAIRDNWCRPLIRFIREQLGHKLTYLGLPSPEAHDILCWLEHIDHIIAFQCRDFPAPSSVAQTKDEILKLEGKLLELERQGQIDSFSLYDGYIEEVLLKGKDTIGKPYAQERMVTVYNLDFCNGITVPLCYYDENQNRHEAYKSDAIKRLLEFQTSVASRTGSAKFVMFLTVHSNFFPDEQKRFLEQEQNAELRRYLARIDQLPRVERNLRTLKTYIYQMLTSFFRTAQFSPEFLPPIYYQGATSRGRPNWLVHFTVVGAYNRNPSSIAPCLQSTTTFLNEKFLEIRNNRFCSMTTPGVSENNARNSSVAAFQNSSIFGQLWR